MPENLSEPNPEGIVGLMLRLRGQGIIDPRLLKAIEANPHNQFVPVEYIEKAWRPRTMPIACGQTMHSPDITARMVAALNPQEHHAVLEIGTGSGYQTALIATLAKKVHSIDRYQSLIEGAQTRLQRLQLSNVTFEQADGLNGKKTKGLYDCIICDLAFPEMPRHLLESLVSGGVLVAAIGNPSEEQDLVRLTKVGSRFERENLFTVRFGAFEAGVAAAL